jgi:hypothetical protein
VSHPGDEAGFDPASSFSRWWSWWYTSFVSTVHPRVQLTLDPELARAVDQAGAYLESRRGRAGLIRALALRGAEVVSREGEHESQARAQAITQLLDCDFSRLSDIVAKRESDLQQRTASMSRSSQPR